MSKSCSFATEFYDCTNVVQVKCQRVLERKCLKSRDIREITE